MTEAGFTSVDFDGLSLLVPDPEVPSVASPWYEYTTREEIRRALPPGGVLVDVGAHVGTIALTAARHVGPGGAVHAVEPSPPTRAALEENAARNGLTNVHVHACAAGASDTSTTFNLMGFSYLNGIDRHPNAGEPVETIEVPVRRLDDLVEGHVDVVKVDVEGGELGVLAGMRELVTRNPGLTLIVEWNPLTMRAAGCEPLALVDKIAELGLQPHDVIDEANGGRRLPVDHVWPLVASGRAETGWWGNIVARGAAA